MIARADFWLALVLAGGLHVLALGYFPSDTSGGGAGQSGDATITIAAVDPALQALVDSWNEPPDAAQVESRIETPTVQAERPEIARLDAAPTRARPSAVPSLPVPGKAPERMPQPEAASMPLVAEAPAPELSPVDQSRRAALSTPKAPEALNAPEAPKFDTAPPDRALAKAPRPDPRPDRVAVAPKRAGGQNGGGTSGTTNVSAAAAVSAEARARAQARWAADIQRRIARYQSYPRGTRANGRVQVSMVILSSGDLSRVSVARSSGAPRLDQAAVRAVEQAAPFPPAPKELSDAWYQVGQWISFERR